MLQAVKMNDSDHYHRERVQNSGVDWEKMMICQSCKSHYGQMDLGINEVTRFDWRCGTCMAINRAELNGATGQVAIKLV